MSWATKPVQCLLKVINFLLLLFGVAVLIYSVYLIHNNSYVVSWGASSLLVSGAIIFVFSSGYAWGGVRYPQFLVMYATVLLFVLLSQLAFLSVYAKKEARGMDGSSHPANADGVGSWAWIKTKGPAVVDLVEHRTHSFRTLMCVLISLESAAIVLSLGLSRCSRPEAFQTGYLEKYESVNFHEQEDLLARNRRLQDHERRKERRRKKMKKLREIRKKFDQFDDQI